MSYGVNAPMGLQPVGTLGNATWNNQTTTAYIASGYAQNIFQGTPVYPLADGTIGLATAGDANPIMGVFWGCNLIAENGQMVFLPYWPANTVVTSPGYPIDVATASIITDPNVIYNIQTTDTLDPNDPRGATVADVYANASLVAGAAPGGNPSTGLSNWSLDVNTIGIGATKQLKIVGFPEIPVNPLAAAGDATDAKYNNVLVTINNHYFKGGTGTVGV
jgi:hypothetical protein